MNATRQFPAPGRRSVLMALILLCPLPLEAQTNLRRRLQIDSVPVGQQSIILEDTTSLFLLPRTHNIQAVQGRATASAASWFQFAMESSIGNLARSTGSNGAGILLSVDEALTVSGTNPGANATIEIELEIEGTFEVRGGFLPATGDPKFDPACSLVVRFQSTRLTSNRTLRFNLQDLITGGGRPRTETTTYPFRARSVVTQLIVVGQPITTDLDFSADAKFTFATFSGAPPPDGVFAPVQELQGLTTRATGRLSGIRVVNNTVQNPVITGSSGTHYTALLRRPDRPVITFFSWSPASRQAILEWQTPADATTSFTLRRAENPALPFNQWTTLTTSATRTGLTSRFETTLPAPSPARQFFMVQPNN